MYVSGFLLAVPEDNKAAYREQAEKFWPIARDFGALSQIEAWEADVRDGETTDFRRAVKCEPGEKVVFSWITWPDKAAADRFEKEMDDDPRMADFGEMPFDGKRMIFGGFETFVEKHAEGD